MNDVLVIAIVIGFFAVCAAYVTWCERVLAADAPDRVARDATAVDRAAGTAGAVDTPVDTPTDDVDPLVLAGGARVRHQ